MNSGTVSLSYILFTTPLNIQHLETFYRPDVEKEKIYFFQTRSGMGVHELGGSTKPVGGAKRAVYTLSASSGIILENSMKLKAGISYRFYQHFYNHTIENNLEDLSERPVVSASNIYLFLGCEFLCKHIGMDIEGGVNLHKPFYETYNDTFKGNSGTKYFLKRYLNTRIGLKLYARNTNKMPKNNLFIGAHINANLSEADFSDISVGYIYLFSGRTNLGVQKY